MFTQQQPNITMSTITASTQKLNMLSNYHESEFFSGWLCVSDSSEWIKVLSEIMVHSRSLHNSLWCLHFNVLAWCKADSQKKAQEMSHIGSSEKLE